MLEYEATAETETKLVCQGLDVTEEGRFPVMDVWTYDGSKITACDFFLDEWARYKKSLRRINCGGCRNSI